MTRNQCCTSKIVEGGKVYVLTSKIFILVLHYKHNINIEFIFITNKMTKKTECPESVREKRPVKPVHGPLKEISLTFFPARQIVLNKL